MAMRQRSLYRHRPRRQPGSFHRADVLLPGNLRGLPEPHAEKSGIFRAGGDQGRAPGFHGAGGLSSAVCPAGTGGAGHAGGQGNPSQPVREKSPGGKDKASVLFPIPLHQYQRAHRGGERSL